MTLMIGEWPYYRRDHTRLLVTLILEIFNPGQRIAPLPGVRYRRIPVECQREKVPGKLQPSIDSKRLRRPICV